MLSEQPHLLVLVDERNEMGKYGHQCLDGSDIYTFFPNKHLPLSLSTCPIPVSWLMLPSHIIVVISLFW